MSGAEGADVEALTKADVSFCMGSGCDVAKEKSDFILGNDDFNSINDAIQEGRAVFDNLRKCIQF